MKPVCVALLAVTIGCAFVQAISVAEAGKFKETVLHSFAGGSDGQDTFAGLIDVKGMLYGATYGGGTYGSGTVFSVNPTTGAEIVLHSFGSGMDGQSPAATLLNVKGTLYGTTYNGGAYALGTVFAVNPNTGGETVLHSFGSGADGWFPFAGLIDLKGILYGTTYAGPYGYGHGTVFSIDPKTGAETVLYSFCSQQDCTDGEFPGAGLIAMNGVLFGTTDYGGTGICAGGCGTVFSVNPTTDAETVVYSFSDGTDGHYVLAGLIDVKGTLYGTTEYGGAQNWGTVFSINPNSGAEAVVYSFGTTGDGQQPEASLIDVKGTLYGTTTYGGAGKAGTVFSIDPNTGAETGLYSFGGGARPEAGLIDAKGTLYGTTYAGGTRGLGTVFALKKER